MFHVEHHYLFDTSFNPSIEPINKVKKSTLINERGSLKKSIPIKAVPKAPIPVHTAYAIPNGICTIALFRRNKLNVAKNKNPIVYFICVNPSDNFMHVVKPTSNKPATTKINHGFILSPHYIKMYP